MPRVKKQSSLESSVSPRPAFTPEAQEQKMIALAVSRAEQQLIDGTASAQVIVHYLKLGASTAKLEKERLEKEIQLLEAKTKSAESSERQEALYKDAIDAMRRYGGYGKDVSDD